MKKTTFDGKIFIQKNPAVEIKVWKKPALIQLDIKQTLSFSVENNSSECDATPKPDGCP